MKILKDGARERMGSINQEIFNKTTNVQDKKLIAYILEKTINKNEFYVDPIKELIHYVEGRNAIRNLNVY